MPNKMPNKMASPLNHLNPCSLKQSASFIVTPNKMEQINKRGKENKEKLKPTTQRRKRITSLISKN